MRETYRETYGIIRDGKLVVVPKHYPGAKPVVYEDVPLFDQGTQYVIQQPPVDLSDHIYMGVEVREVEQDDEQRDEEVF
jgi:hypothetical protein